MPLIVWSRLFPGKPESVAHAREFVRALLENRTDTYVCELLVSELATNAVLYTNSGAVKGWFVVHVVVFVDRVRLRVFDLGHPQNKPTVTLVADDDAESGRGLYVVESLAWEWGVEGDDVGRVVWADLPLPRTKFKR